MTSEFITTNDRSFACGVGASCANDFARDSSLGIRNVIGHIDLDARFLDTNAIRDNLTALISAVSEAIADILSWVDRAEHEFAIKYAANEIVGDVSLFNQINVVLLKIKRLRSSLNAWLSGFHQTVLDTSELINEYNIATSTLHSESVVSSASLLQNAVSLAKQNIGKSRSLGKKIKQILKLDSAIKNQLVKLQSMAESFYTGSIRVNDKLINLRDFEQTILSLSGNQSPLAQIQAKLAQEINSHRESLSINSVQPQRIVTPEENCVYGMCDTREISEMNVERLVERLKRISVRMLYTEHTRKQLDQVIDSAIEITKHSDRLLEITQLCQRIKNNTPSKVIDYYKLNVRNPNGKFARLSNLKQLIENLFDSDSAYAPILQDIYDEMSQDVETEIQNTNGNDDDDNVGDSVFLEDIDMSEA